MRLALYHPWVYLKGGIERTLLELMRRSRHEWVLYTHHYDAAATFADLTRQRVVQLSPPVSVRRSLLPLARAAAVISSTRLPDDGCRGLLVSSEGLGDLVLLRNGRLPAVCYCHTPLKILHDTTTRKRLVDGSRLRSVGLHSVGLPFAAVDRRLWGRYRHVLVNSMETGERLRKAGLSAEGRLEVLYPGVDTARFGAGERARAPATFLVAGRIMWQKNVELAIDALRVLHGAGTQAELVVAGAVDAKSQDYLAALRARAAGRPVRFEVGPGDERLAELYATCTALVFTPPSEDWGIVPLEAMASGAPVLAVNAGGPVESVVDGVTGWLLPARAEVFAARMSEVLRMGEPALAGMRIAARRRAALFDWDGFARRVDEVMEDAVG